MLAPIPTNIAAGITEGPCATTSAGAFLGGSKIKMAVLSSRQSNQLRPLSRIAFPAPHVEKIKYNQSKRIDFCMSIWLF